MSSTAAATASPVLESDFQAYIFAALNAPGRSTRIMRINSGIHFNRDEQTGKVLSVVRGARKGTADLIGLVRPEGLFIAVELKGAKTRHTPQQQRWADFICSMGGIYVLVRYDASRSLAENVMGGVALVDEAIIQRRLGRARDD